MIPDKSPTAAPGQNSNDPLFDPGHLIVIKDHGVVIHSLISIKMPAGTGWQRPAHT
jgi:hypothetical protein